MSDSLLDELASGPQSRQAGSTTGIPTPTPTTTTTTTTSGGEIRRNVACVNCRDSKVRCKPGTAPGQPCQRCSKQQVKCVFNKAHKRETRRSKLAQLEAELKRIKQVVNSTPSHDTTPHTTLPLGTARSIFSEQAVTRSVPEATWSARSGGGDLSPPSEQGQPMATDMAAIKGGPTQPRRLRDHHVSGDDIDAYFSNYLEHFHPYMPILRKKNPDECHAASPPLFWTVVYIASRRYRPRGHDDSDPFLLQTTLVDDYLADAVWSGAASPAMGLEAVHALLLLAAWPLPSVRLSTDPSAALVGVALNACLCMGLHAGPRSRREFAAGVRQQQVLSGVTDEEVAATWAACCALAQKTAAHAGRPPLPVPLSEAPWKSVLDRRPAAWAGLVALFNIHQFLARFHTAMAAQVAAHECTDDASVQSWEDDFDVYYPAAVAAATDSNADTSSRFAVLAARLEIQSYYFHSPPGLPPGPSFHLRVAKIFATARAMVLTAVDLENKGGFITHIPQWGFRALFDAACIILSILHSANAPQLAPPPPLPSSGSDAHQYTTAAATITTADADADAIARQAYEAVLRCSVWDYDLPHRGGIILETYWMLRDEIPPHERAPCALVHRTGAGVALWVLGAFKDRLIEVSHKTTKATRALDVMRMAAKKPDHNTQHQPTPAETETMCDMDWTKFLDEFEWDGNNSLFLT